MDIQTQECVQLFDKCRNFTKAREIQAAGLYPYFKPISESEDTAVVIEGQKRIMLGSNNYLGLTHHPKVLEAASRALCPLRVRLHRQPLPQRHPRPARPARALACRVPRQGRLPGLLDRLLGQPRLHLRAWSAAATWSISTSSTMPRSSTAPRCPTARPCASTMATWAGLDRLLERTRSNRGAHDRRRRRLLDGRRHRERAGAGSHRQEARHRPRRR